MPYQLVLQFAATSLDDYDRLIQLEDGLIEELGPDLVDGHDFGSGEFNIFIITDDVHGMFKRAQPIVNAHPYARSMTAGYRDLDAHDYLPLWPSGSTQFKVI